MQQSPWEADIRSAS